VSADQLRRAADKVAEDPGQTYCPEAERAVATLLRAIEQRHRPYSLNPSFCGYCGEDVPWPCPDAEDATRVAAAYLGEEAQP
jgi:hypothetical protein